MRADGRAATPLHADSVRPPRGAHAATWMRPGRPPGAPDRARLCPCSQKRSSTRALALSLACAQQQPRCRSPLPPPLVALSPGSSGLLPPICDYQRLRLALLHPALVLNRPVELTRVSRSFGDLSARAVLPLLSAIACVLKCVSFALASRIVSRQ